MNDENDFMLSTYDNSFNPFTEFEAWLKEDARLGHNCCGLLARTSNVNDIASDQENNKKILEAMDFIVRQEPTIYRKVLRSDYA
jgi:hypothetical protein